MTANNTIFYKILCEMKALPKTNFATSRENIAKNNLTLNTRFQKEVVQFSPGGPKRILGPFID